MVICIRFAIFQVQSRLKTHSFLKNCKTLQQLTSNIHSSTKLQTFWERHPKGGYDTKGILPSRTQLIRDGLQELKKEINLWQQEVKEKFETDPLMVFRPGETDVVWNLNSPAALENWVTTSDRDHGEGLSSCQLVMSPAGKGLFCGNLDTTVPKDGRIKKSGYCNMRTLRARKSFKRDSCLDWGMYNQLVLRVRGDGRSYMLNVATSGYFDLLWNDIYHFVLYTRGGPYWQVTKIPFSKFFLASKGRVQDKQLPISLDKVTSFGISAGDKINGPFNLEIDYIGLEFDPTHQEEFAYEMYSTPKYIVAT